MIGYLLYRSATGRAFTALVDYRRCRRLVNTAVAFTLPQQYTASTPYRGQSSTTWKEMNEK